MLILFFLPFTLAGIDVDKLDYLKRDNAACGELTTSEFSALYENMRVSGWYRWCKACLWWSLRMRLWGSA